MGITRQNMGVPVVAIGVPTVVDAATMANDTLDMLIGQFIRQAKLAVIFTNSWKP